MYALISVTRDQLEVITSFHKTKPEAINTMIEDMITTCGYQNIEAIIKDANEGNCSLTEDYASAETLRNGEGTWTIEKIPETL